MEHNYYRVWTEIDLDAIRSNILSIEEIYKDVPDLKFCAVIKADGYGHGAVQIAEYIDDITDFYAVATLPEAVELRTSGVSKPILILGFLHTGFAPCAIENDISLTVFDVQTAEKLSAAAQNAGRDVKIHIKIDTGMSRIGFVPDEGLAEKILYISHLPGIQIEGIFTHFFSADDDISKDDLASARGQFEKFSRVCKELDEAGLHIPVKHCSNSAAATRLPGFHMDMVRLGISIYGLYPSEYVDEIKLTGALSMKSHVSMVKTVPAGTTVGYGATFTAERETVLATIPVGYADGYMRLLSNKADVLIGGKRARIAGRVCMDQFMVDVTDLGPVKEGDEVILIGKSGEEEITADELAGICGTIGYEFTCQINKRVPRVYYAGGRLIACRDHFA